MIGILLAAGRGTRMKSERPKVLFEINDEPMCFGSYRALFELCNKVIVVVGYRGEDVRRAILDRAVEVFGEKLVNDKTMFMTQDPPKGTGDAVRVAMQGFSKQGQSYSEVIVCNGDLPLIRKTTLQKMATKARQEKLLSVCLAMRTSKPKGLGRILRDETGVFSGIKEEKDCTPDEKRIVEVNGGVYYFNGNYLSQGLEKLNSKNAQGEFYLTDLLGNKDRKTPSDAFLVRNAYDLLGVNTTFELPLVRKIAQSRLQRKICEEMGVELKDPRSAYISARAKFTGPSVVGPNTVIKGACVIAEDVVIDGNSYLENSSLAKGAHVLWGSVLSNSKVGERSSVGPMAHLRPGSQLDSDVKVGNFVELKKAHLKKGAKASHLSYLGDAEIGEESNIGCGTITCNYDGFAKHFTSIGKGAFIGSDTQLIAPVNVGDGAYVGSGTTVTDDVPSGALALSRTEMVIKPGYAKKLSDKLEAQKKAKLK